MKYKGTLIVVKDCNRALKFYSDMFGFQLLQDNDGNMELTNNLYLQESGYWEQFTKRSVIPNSNQSELYFEEPNIEQFVERLETLYPEIEYVKIDKIRGMDIIFVTTANTDEEAKELLTLLGAPFAKA